MRVHIQGKGHNIDIAGTLTIAKQSSFNSIRAGKQAEFGIRHRTAPVVVGMKRNDHVFTVFQMVAHIFHLIGVNVRKRHGDGDRKVDDDLIIRRWFPDIQHSIADFKRKFHFSSRKAFRGILKLKVPFYFLRVFFQHFCAEYSNVNDFFFGFTEHLFPLSHRSGIVKMNDRVLRAFQRFKGFFDDVLTRLGQYLNGYVVRNQVLLN